MDNVIDGQTQLNTVTGLQFQLNLQAQIQHMNNIQCAPPQQQGMQFYRTSIMISVLDQ